MLMTQFALIISVQSFILCYYNVQMAAGNSNHIITHKGKKILNVNIQHELEMKLAGISFSNCFL